MNEKTTSAFDGIKKLVGDAHVKETIAETGEKIKEAIADIDIREAVEDIKDGYSHGGVKEAISSIGEKIKEAADKATTVVQESIRHNPGAAIDVADSEKVSNEMVKEDVRSLNNNPRNSDM